MYETWSRNRLADCNEEILCLFGDRTEAFENNRPTFWVNPEGSRGVVGLQAQETKVLTSEQVGDQSILLFAVCSDVARSRRAIFLLQGQPAFESADVDLCSFDSIARACAGARVNVYEFILSIVDSWSF